MENVFLNKTIYLVDRQDIYYLEDLRQTLLREIKRETIELREEKDIVESNLKLLDKFYNINYGYNEDFIVNELKSFGYDIIKVNEVVDNLTYLEDYFKSLFNSDTKTTLLEKTQEYKKEVVNYFNN